MPLRIAEESGGGDSSTDVRLRCNLTEDITESTSTFMVDGIESITGSFQGATIDDVHNDMDWTAEDGALCFIERVEELSIGGADYWQAYQVKCPPVVP
jgi:hypothetical protein